MQEPLDRRGIEGVNRDVFVAPAFVGSPETLLPRLQAVLAGTGARTLILILRLRGVSGEISRQTQRLLAERVFPHLRNLPVTTPEPTFVTAAGAPGEQ